MSNWSSWMREHPFIALITIVFGGSIGLAALTLLLVPIFLLAEANALLGFFGLFVLAFFGYFAVSQFTDTESETDTDETLNPVTELKQRYARGELSDSAFEHRLERLIETDAALKRTSAQNETNQAAQHHPGESQQSQAYDTEQA